MNQRRNNKELEIEEEKEIRNMEIQKVKYEEKMHKRIAEEKRRKYEELVYDKIVEENIRPLLSEKEWERFNSNWSIEPVYCKKCNFLFADKMIFSDGETIYSISRKYAPIKNMCYQPDMFCCPRCNELHIFKTNIGEANE